MFMLRHSAEKQAAEGIREKVSCKIFTFQILLPSSGSLAVGFCSFFLLLAAGENMLGIFRISEEEFLGSKAESRTKEMLTYLLCINNIR